MGLDEVLSDLEGEGYAARPFIVPACAADAPHRRDRVWIIAKDMAHAESKQRHERHDDKRNEASAEEGVRGEARASCSNVANTERKRQQGQGPQGNASDQEANGEGQAAQSFNGSLRDFWLPEPAVGRVANGIPRRVDRLRGLGNAIVPQVAQRIGETIKAVEMQDGR